MSGIDVGALTRRLYDEVWNAKRYEVTDELFDPDYLSTSAPGLRGGAAKAAAIRTYHTAFPDLHVTIDELLVTGDRTAVRFTVSGTDTGGLRGRPPTGRAVNAWGVEHLHFRDGRIHADWIGVDWLGVLVQLGIIANPWTA